MSGGLGLREQKKLTTRRDLGRAALRLALTDGFEGLTPDRIAEAANVSPRTFRNYFSSKEEAVVFALQERASHVAANLRARPAGEPVCESLRVVLTEATRDMLPVQQLMKLMSMVRCHQALMAQHLTNFDALSAYLAEVIAERTGTDAATDVYPRLLADAAGIAVKTSMRLWAQGNTGRGIDDILGEAFDLLSRGFPEPVTAIRAAVPVMA
jgi:AcrR family transcriptional regulator